MSEYIKKEDIEQKIQDGLNNLVLGHDAIEVLGMIYEMPSEDVAPVRHGRWEKTKEWATKAKYRCSVCGREIMSAVKVNIEKYPYCHCGAKMEDE